MTPKTIRAAATATLLLVAGFTRSDTPNALASAAACTGSVSGAVSGSYSCTPVTAVWSKESNIGALTINTTGSPTFVNGIGFPGTPTVRTYTNADAGAMAGVSVMSGPAVWQASSGKGPSQGSYSLKLTSVGAARTTPGGNRTYPVHGSLTVTLSPVAGSAAKGNVTVNFTF